MFNSPKEYEIMMLVKFYTQILVDKSGGLVEELSIVCVNPEKVVKLVNGGSWVKPMGRFQNVTTMTMDGGEDLIEVYGTLNEVAERLAAGCVMNLPAIV